MSILKNKLRGNYMNDILEKIEPSQIEEFEGLFEKMTKSEQTAFRYLLIELGYDYETAKEKYKSVNVHDCEPTEYAKQYVDEFVDIPCGLVDYIDYHAIAQDMLNDGTWCEFENHIISNANDF